MNNFVPPIDENRRAETSLPIAGGRMCVCVPGLTAHLRELKVCSVRMEYQGANGRGDFVYVEYLRSDGTHIKPLDPTVHATVLQAVFQSLLSFRHPDWNEREGSAGDFRWDLSADSLIHTHYTRGPNGNERTTHHNL
jgi:hypothetical protein